MFCIICTECVCYFRGLVHFQNKNFLVIYSPSCQNVITAWFHHSARFFYNHPSSSVIFDNQLTFKEHIAKTARSCRFALHNIRKIRLFPYTACSTTSCPGPSFLDYCNALLVGLPSCTIKPLQMIQNAAARLVFSEPKRAHVTPLFISLHWLLVAARIQFKTLMLAYRTTTGSAPTYFHSLLQIYIPSRSLRSASERRLVVPSQRGSKSLSRTFSFTVPGRWNELPTPIRTAESLTIFKWHLKTNLFHHHLTFSKKKIKFAFRRVLALQICSTLWTVTYCNTTELNAQ